MSLALSIRGLKKQYENGFQAVKGIDLSVAEGDFFALLGPNGAGKSTTIGILCSLIKKTDGVVKIFDVDIDENFPKAKTLIGIVPQEFNFNNWEKIEDILIQQAGYYGIPRKLAQERAEKYLKLLDLWEKRSGPARQLSGGMKRRLMIARALVHEPKLLILDEPTAGVDIELRRSMWDFLRKINGEGTTIILTTHYLEEAESLCRNIAIIDEGKIIQDSSMRDLLKKLNQETLILDLNHSVPDNVVLNGYKLNRIDDACLEVEVEKGKTLNDLFNQLQNQGLQIVSMRNKSNRLEELFVTLVQGNKGVSSVGDEQ